MGKPGEFSEKYKKVFRVNGKDICNGCFGAANNDCSRCTRRENEMKGMRNSEGYYDPTASMAMSDAHKEEQSVDTLNHKVMQSFRLLVDLAGFEIVGRVTLKHKKSGRIFK